MAAVFEIYQSPEKPYLVDYFNLLLKGEINKAMEMQASGRKGGHSPE